jgi:hypothetical protein
MKLILFTLTVFAMSWAHYHATESVVRAFNAAFVRIVANGDWETVVNTYGKAFSAAWTCSAAPNQYPFPSFEALGENDALKIALNNNSISVLGFQANWASDGDYTVDPPTGFWPDMLEKLVAQIRSEYVKPDLKITRVYLPTSAKILNALDQGQALMTEPYFFGSSLYEADDGKKYFRHEKFTMSCTMGGAQHTVFTKKSSTIKTQVALNHDLHKTSAEAPECTAKKIGVLTEGNKGQYEPVVSKKAQWMYKTIVTVNDATALNLCLTHLKDDNEVLNDSVCGGTNILAGWTLVSILPSGAQNAITPSGSSSVSKKQEVQTAHTGYSYPVKVTFDHFVDTTHLVNGVINGQVCAGIASSTAALYSNANLNAFGLSLVSPQAALFRKGGGASEASGAKRAPVVASLGFFAVAAALELL